MYAGINQVCSNVSFYESRVKKFSKAFAIESGSQFDNG